MVDQVAVQAAVSVRERVDIDEAKGERRGCQDRIEMRRSRAVECHQTVDQGLQILRAGADMVGQRHARVAIVLADKAAFVAQSQPHEAGVADDDALQP